MTDAGVCETPTDAIRRAARVLERILQNDLPLDDYRPVIGQTLTELSRWLMRGTENGTLPAESPHGTGRP